MFRDNREPRTTDIEQPHFTTHDEWYASFLKNTAQKDIQLWETNHHLMQYPSMRERMLDSSYQFDSLFVGGGTGAAEVALVYSIAHGGRRMEDFMFKGVRPSSNLRVHYVDPSLEMYKRFAANLEASSGENALEGIALRKFEDPFYKPPDVDLALGFQMWYYVDGWRGVSFEQNSLVKYAKTVSKKSGIAVLSIQSADGDLFKVRGKQLPKIHGYKDLVAQEVIGELERLGLSYEASEKQASTDVKSFFQDGKFNPTEEGKNILSFMLRTSWDRLSSEIKKEVEKDVLELVEKNKSNFLHKDDTVLFFKDKYIFIPGDQPKLAA